MKRKKKTREAFKKINRDCAWKRKIVYRQSLKIAKAQSQKLYLGLALTLALKQLVLSASLYKSGHLLNDLHSTDSPQPWIYLFYETRKFASRENSSSAK